MLDPD
jgi:hypothetical protein